MRIALRSGGHQNISEEYNILLQGTKDMTLASGAIASMGTARLALLVLPGSILTGVRVQARVRQRQSYNSWLQPQRSDLRFIFTVNTRGSGLAPDNTITVSSEPGRILQETVSGLVFSEIAEPSLSNIYDPSAFSYFDNYIDEYFEISRKEIANEIYVYFQAVYGSSNTNAEEMEIYSLTFDYEPVGCEGVQVRSLDGRLISVTEGKDITYPILFLGREPVREDAQGWKEVLVFQDKATTLRVVPQPIVLNEENEYAANAAAESNGHWMLYEYDSVRLRPSLGSGLSLTAGAGNDILQVRKNPNFTLYGLYDMALLFSTDTSDEPYIVPVVLDYAVPLSVNGQEQRLSLNLTEYERCVVLDIVRDRYWRVVGLPEDLTVGLMEGVRNASTILCLSGDYSRLGKHDFSFLIQSGIKRVIVSVSVTFESIFDVSKNYVLLQPDLDPAKHYKEVIYVKRRNFGDGIVFGYNVDSITNHTIQREILTPLQASVEVPPEFTAGEPIDTYYDRITITYTGDVINASAGRADTTAVFRPLNPDSTPVANGAVNVRCYRNIELNFEITGINNRPSATNDPWSFTKSIYSTAMITTGSAWLYLTAHVADKETFAAPDVYAPMIFRANRAITRDGNNSSSAVIGGSANAASAPSSVNFSTELMRLNALHSVTLQFTSYQRYEHNSTFTGVQNANSSAYTIVIQFETRCNHFFRTSNVYLQWDNNWIQHHWLLTNPDAVIAIQPLSSGSDLEYEPTSNITSGDLLTKWSHPVDTNDIDIYTVKAKSSVPVSILDDTFLDGQGNATNIREIRQKFNVIVYHPELIRNEIVPQMAASNQEIDILDNIATSDFEVIGDMTSDDFMLFNRDNRAEVFTSAVGKSFTVTLDRPRIIRSWSYSVLGDAVACGFLIEGWLDGIDEWEPISAVSEYSTLPTQSYGYGSTEDAIVIDYVTVAPRPWNKVRVTTSRVRGTPGLDGYRVGQFQFYEGYPILKRMPALQLGNREHRQLNTRDGRVNYFSSDPSYIVVSVADGRLLSSEILANIDGNPVVDGIGLPSYYRGGYENNYWNYPVVNGDATLTSIYTPGLAHMGLRLASNSRIVGIRYDTAIVQGYTTAGAIAVEVSDNENIALTAVYSRLITIIADRFLGQASLPLDTLNLDVSAQAVLTDFAQAAQSLLYDDVDNSADVVEGTTILQVNTLITSNDYRKVKYNGTQWENIGQDMILDNFPITQDSPTLLANPLVLSDIAAAWKSAVASSEPILRDRLAITNPVDRHRLLYRAGMSPEWVDLGEDSFEPYKGRQFYRNVNEPNVRSIRVHIAGLADTAYNWHNSGCVRAILGEIQFFEQFFGSNITYRDIRVDGSSVKYGDTVVLTAGNTVQILCEGLRVNGMSAEMSRIFAQIRNVTGDILSWQAFSAQASTFTLETNYTSTSVTLFYRQGTGTSNTDRMYPFFTFVVEKS